MFDTGGGSGGTSNLKAWDMADSTTKTGVVDINPRNFSWRKEPRRLSSDKVTHIIIHHAAAVRCSAIDIHKWHLQRDNGTWSGAGYNFFIRKDGSIWEMRGFNSVGAHSGRNWNGRSMGVCFEGHFEKEVPTEAQLNSGADLCASIMGRFPNIGLNHRKIIKHSQATSTACPGSRFPWEDKLIYKVMNVLKANSSVAAQMNPDELGIATGGLTPYIVKPGDTWESVSNKYKLDVGTLKLINESSRGITGNLRSGMSLLVPNTLHSKAIEAMGITDSVAGGLYGNIEHSHEVTEREELAGSSNGMPLDYGGSPIDPNLVAMDMRAGTGLATGIPNRSDMMGLPQKRQGLARRRDNLGEVSSITTYEKFTLQVELSDHIGTFKFLVDPNATRESRSRNIQNVQTKGGNIIVDGGTQPVSKSVSGYLLDYNGKSEALDFVQFYEDYIASGRYKKIYLDFEGVLSLVEITGVSISATAQNNILKSYSISFLVLSENRGRNSLFTPAPPPVPAFDPRTANEADGGAVPEPPVWQPINARGGINKVTTIAMSSVSLLFEKLGGKVRSVINSNTRNT